MQELTPEQLEARKRAMYEAMSPRQRRYIDTKVGYDNWDPFAPPKDPIDIRTDPTKRTAHQLVHEFLQTRRAHDADHAFSQGVLQMAVGLVNGDERCRGMYEFSVWYARLLEREAKS